MKRLFLLAVIAALALMPGGCRKYDDSALREEIADLKQRLEAVESLNAYKDLLAKLDNGKTVVAFSETDGVYTLTFDDNSSISFNQKGESGQQGQPGATPLFRINPNTVAWEVSYDGGQTWTEAGSAVDRSLICGVSLAGDGNSITLTLADGTAVTIPCNSAEETGSGLLIPYALRDNMVLQQNTGANIWGWADPGSVIKVSTSWNASLYRATAGDDGLWKVTVATPAASLSPQWVNITCGGQSFTLENILIGEVWLCSGQSNMEMPVSGWQDQPVEGSAEAIQDAFLYPEVRMFMAQKTASAVKQRDVQGRWHPADDGYVAEFSATAYFFGRELARKLNVPIGLIVPCWGGTLIECWMDREALMNAGLTAADIDRNIGTYAGSEPWYACTMMYNAMIYPLRHYTIGGFIWYHGCSNVFNVYEQDYARYQTAMVTRWRKLFGRGDLPFYFVQIAPFSYGGNVDSGFAPRLRERQKAAASMVSNSAMTGTCDLVYEYERDAIHPRKKVEVGQRLANLALEHWYGLQGCHSDCPDLERVIFEGNSAKMLFSHCDEGLHAGGGMSFGDIGDFEVAGEDKAWRPAHISGMQGNTLTVTSEQVADVQYVRYLWHDFAIGHIHNSHGLPLLPFTSEQAD